MIQAGCMCSVGTNGKKMRLRTGLLLRALSLLGVVAVVMLLWMSSLGGFGDVSADSRPARRFHPVAPWPQEGGERRGGERRGGGGGGGGDAEPRPPPGKLELLPERDADIADDDDDDDDYKAAVAPERRVTFKPQTRSSPLPELRPGSPGNLEPREREAPGVPGGPGEASRAVAPREEQRAAVRDSVREFGFNMVASDAISLDRSIADLRHDECKYWHYDEALPPASVVIVFHNEGWSTLLRTVHSVVKRTPARYLAELVLIDDFSSKEHLKGRLDDYVAERWNGLVTVVRNERREGLIQSRSIGARKATRGQVLVYLDAHCEVGINWYPPLAAPIAHDRTTSTVPLIDYINGMDYTMEPQQGGDDDGFARGAWDWSLLWKRIPLSERERARRKHKTEPYRSPAMAGGLFAIDRDFFFELGLYDPGLQIWGGENFEISYKIWQCGGTLLFVPCSRVGHIYRLEGWAGNPPPPSVGPAPALQNYVRVVEVWWDDYRDYFYASRPETQALPYGDVSALHRFRREHNCKSFSWFMENIAYDVLQFYPLPPKNVDWGEIRGKKSNFCIDSMGHNNGGLVELGPCHGLGGNQLFRLNDMNQLMQHDQCLTQGGKEGTGVTIVHCDRTEFNDWSFRMGEGRFVHSPSGRCLDRSETLQQVFLALCNPTSLNQRWEINHIKF
ncbi:N-acetylgalactosaminyltransferase 7-like isoform X2 [Petromyzon marinus]|uniref:N-acetylgalactosaminyltransferase 7-like isoform X2 n=1 Tax=Petromyzon marinus TaxID=7757 RepID=UPI003F726999